MRAYCLADLFNLDLWPTGRPPNSADIRHGLEQLTERIVATVPAAHTVTTRLYGGWHGDVPSSMRDLRPMVNRAATDMPRRLGRQVFRLELAESPVWDRSVPIRRSVRLVRNRRFKTHVDHAPHCVLGPDRCSLPSFESWCAGRCPKTGCPVRLREVASRYSQKMIDTLLTADAMAIRYERLADTVVLASDDDDLIPAMLALAASDVALVHLTRRKTPSFYRGVLEREGASIHEW